MKRHLVRDLMTGMVPSVRPGDTLARLFDLMETRHVRHVAVVDRPRGLVGLVAHGDLMRHAVAIMEDMSLAPRRDHLETMKVAEIMTTAVLTIEPERDAFEAAELMVERGIGCLPVVEGEVLIGLLTESDFVRWEAGQAHPAAAQR
jgi:CBS domain-containing membrane protein